MAIFVDWENLLKELNPLVSKAKEGVGGENAEDLAKFAHMFGYNDPHCVFVFLTFFVNTKPVFQDPQFEELYRIFLYVSKPIHIDNIEESVCGSGEFHKILQKYKRIASFNERIT
ncbi:hypothetical protein [Helicobacter heilmannii]|uniref:hypothetical protein n=1 Tax=Helicobacter heilmannii TaxID=35817 RepID=UPI0006A01998|nr:hypothetical protein [Helicobacter heilmannii]GMB95167.1 hypothetical protein NHP21011_12660 [Helicobacter heilmannii]CRF45821.1 hypothetical protein HHE014_07980 [Helicobacter heilmannii]